MHPEVDPCKGCFGGECNRFGCTNTDARYFHRFKHAYYCAACARKIDVTEVTDASAPNCFDYPQKPDTSDRHKNKREKPYAKDHPDQDNQPQCPTCGAFVNTIFDHIDIDCEHD